MGLTYARWTDVPVEGPTKRYFQHLNRFSSAFAFVCDVSMLTLGGKLKFMESTSGRLGDMLSMMYLTSATLKHYEDQGRPEEDLPLVEWACRDLLYRNQEQLHSMLRNFLINGYQDYYVFVSSHLAADIIRQRMNGIKTLLLSLWLIHQHVDA